MNDTATGQPEAEKAYKITELAELKSVSTDFVRRAIRAKQPPFLRAKKVGNEYRISASAAEAWWDSLPDG